MRVRSACVVLAVVGYLTLSACDGQNHPNGRAPSEPPPSTSLSDRYSQHVVRLRRELDSALTIVAKPPFVLIGDGPAEEVVDVAERVVETGSRLLKQDFFELDPNMTDIWVLRSEKSYRAACQRLFHHDPETPYGFYVPRRHTMVMNLATGSGTLMHEMVHPFIETNLPGCTSWFNEGFASLFEGTALRDGHLIGVPNWRLPNLQRQIRERSLPSLTRMMQLDEAAFYDATDGNNYAEARYLFYYLQEHALLSRYYRAFRAGRARDRSGVSALREVLGDDDLDAFDARWRNWVLGIPH